MKNVEKSLVFFLAESYSITRKPTSDLPRPGTRIHVLNATVHWWAERLVA